MQLKLDAYCFMQHGTAKSVIKTISEGSFATDDNNVPVTPYFKVRVTTKEVHLCNVPPDFRLIPGLTLDGDIMVGRRTNLIRWKPACAPIQRRCGSRTITIRFGGA